MKAYRICWLTLCIALGAVGTVVALSWSISVALVFFTCAAACGAVLGTAALGPEDAQPESIVWRQVFVGAAVGGLVTVAVIGMGVLLGAGSALMLLLLGVGSSPTVIRFCRRGLGQSASDSPSAPPSERSDQMAESAVAESSDDAETQPQSLTDAQLCTAWRISFSALEKARTEQQRLRIVEERQDCLDELERRNPHGLAAWLASGARAAGDPTRFVLGDRSAASTSIDWDGLIHGRDF
ncbi:MAG: hypothetical protein QOH50_541 [Kribbellaceae bacterium]|jgi:hypothetical protein|nr:hypothetical protein [Kribbellaceae bacterium]